MLKWVRGFLLLFGFALFVLPLPAAAQTEAKAPVTVPLYQSAQRHLLVRLRVNGEKPLLFIFDTGASFPLIVEPWAAKTLHLAPTSKTTLEGIPLGIAPLQSVRAFGGRGEVNLPGLDKAYLAPRPLFSEPYNGEQAAGIVGFGMLQHLVVTLDLNRLEMRFLPDVPNALKQNAVALKLHKPGGGFGRFYLEAQVEGGVPFLALIDTGSEMSIFNPKRIQNAVGTRVSSRRLSAYMGAAGTPYTFGEAQLKTLRLGDEQAESFVVSPPFLVEPDVVVALDAPAPGAKPFGADLLGLGFLRRFTLTFDENKDAVYLRRAPDYQKQARLPGWIGAAIIPAPETASSRAKNGFPIFGSVEYDLPAHRVGIKPGDFLISVDDKPAEISAETPFERVQGWLNDFAGTSVRLTVRTKNDKERTVTLTRISPFERSGLFDNVPDTGVVFAHGVRSGVSVWVITFVEPSSWGDKCGLAEGDEIINLNGKPSAGLSIPEFFTLWKGAAQKPLRLGIKRGNKTAAVILKLK